MTVVVGAVVLSFSGLQAAPWHDERGTPYSTTRQPWTSNSDPSSDPSNYVSSWLDSPSWYSQVKDYVMPSHSVADVYNYFDELQEDLTSSDPHELSDADIQYIVEQSELAQRRRQQDALTQPPTAGVQAS
ncbi:hypothetical protein H4R35_002185 [Dimargaris xerosporica]|nr:hypothetical protein H4R35_002185 [Dimargaris xerosporica]